MESRTITHLLAAWQAGDKGAKNQLFDLLYDELHRMARSQRQLWRGNNTLNVTALLHELYLKLSRMGALRAEDRGQFNRYVTKVMRHLLIDYARSRSARRRGGEVVKVSLDAFDDNVAVDLGDQVESLLVVDSALLKLKALEPRLSEVVELRFFGGLTHDEIALSLNLTKRTVTRDWAKAKVLLHRILSQSPSLPG